MTETDPDYIAPVDPQAQPLGPFDDDDDEDTYADPEQFDTGNLGDVPVVDLGRLRP